MVSILRPQRRWIAASVLGTTLLAAGAVAAEDAAPAESAKPAAPARKSGSGGVLGLIRTLVTGAVEAESVAADAAVELIDSSASADSEGSGPAEAVTHSRIVKVPIRSEQRRHSLQNFSLTPEGHAVVLLGLPRYYSDDEKQPAKRDGEVRVLSIGEDGKAEVLAKWTTDFSPQSVNAAKDGTIYVAGDGRIARFKNDGELIAEVDAPHLKLLLADRDALKQRAKEQLDEENEGYEQQIKTLEQMRSAQLKRKAAVKKASKADGDEPGETATEEDPDKDRFEEVELEDGRKVQIMIPSLSTQIRQMKESIKQNSKRTVDDVVNGIVGRMKIINAITIGEQDVFIASAAAKGYGYDVWRMDHSFANAEKIVTGLSGCCGQMDIQCDGECVFVAENSRHRVLQYDREGKKIASWGKTDRQGRGAGFGSCCNPMNLRFGSGGTLFTAESEGKIKKFSPAGEFQGLVAHVKVEQGCKNVPIAMSTDGKRAYFCDLPGKQLMIAFESEAPAAQEAASVK